MAPFSSLLRSPWPAAWRALAVLLLYAAYLPLSGYGPGQFRFDAAEYWELSLKFTRTGGFSLLAFDRPLRGYLGPLLVLPARLLCHFTGWSMLTGAQVLGAGWAALLLAWPCRQLWAQATGRRLTGGAGWRCWRWLYFLARLLQLHPERHAGADAAGAGAGGAGPAGLGLGSAGGLVAGRRPSISGPFTWPACRGCCGCCWRLRRPAPRWRLRPGAGLVAGRALVLLPQCSSTGAISGRLRRWCWPQQPGGAPLTCKQLSWGTAFQRYETSLIPEIPRSLVYADPAGQRGTGRRARPAALPATGSTAVSPPGTPLSSRRALPPPPVQRPGYPLSNALSYGSCTRPARRRCGC